MRRRMLIAVATAVSVTSLILLAGIPAAQASTALCGNGGSGYCMNAWNGGPYVKMYYGGYSNDYFYLQSVALCSGHATVQATESGDSTNCPFNDGYVDYVLHGDLIVEIVYGNNGECVGTTGSGVGYLGACGNSSGSGASNGVFDVLYPDYCSSGNELVNRYWSNHDGNDEFAFVTSGGSVGASLYVDDLQSATCWG